MVLPSNQLFFPADLQLKAVEQIQNGLSISRDLKDSQARVHVPFRQYENSRNQLT